MKTITKLILFLGGGLVAAGMNAQSVTFNYTGSSQTWTVPCGVSSITVLALGAQGGYSGGLGASIQGTFTVTPGTTYSIIVGQVGYNPTGNVDNSGGGGGGSFVYNGGTLLVAAGGGGGQCYYSHPITPSANGTTSTTGNNTSGGGASGGSAGNGGNAGPYGGGGAGWLTNGTPSPFGGYTSPTWAGGTGYCAGGGGGCGGDGGYGGGGGGGNAYGGGGGGGGYSGGGGGVDPQHGGGGGSYNAGSNQTNTGGVNSGNGSVTITWISVAPSVTASVVNNVACLGGSNGSLHGAVTGGGTPYTYLWTPSAQTNATATGLTAGTYTIKVTDACGNTTSASVAITQPTALAATATTTSNVHCNGGSTGATGSTVTGGTTPYTYAWTGGSTNATATGLTAGSYTLSVTDKNGCSATASTVVTQPNALSDSAFTINNVLCNGGSTGSASNIAKGGSSPYTYLWTPGGSTKDTATGLSAGTYTVTVKDACGASATTSATITQPTAISITSHSAPDNGHGVGTAVVSVSGGVGPYTYLWTGGNTTDSIGGLTEGTYCVDVKDANGCKDSICVFVKIASGIDGITSGSAQISVYPNPNNGQFTIESSIGGASTVEIYNILGEKVFTRSLSTTKGTNTISVNQPNGVYLYRIISDNGNLLGEGRISIQK